MGCGVFGVMWYEMWSWYEVALVCVVCVVCVYVVCGVWYQCCGVAIAHVVAENQFVVLFLAGASKKMLQTEIKNYKNVVSSRG